MQASSIFRTALVLLSIAFASGLVMAVIRFTSDRRSPAWLAKSHGFAAVAALSLLIFGWATVAFSRMAAFGVVTLLVAAAAGLILSLRYRSKQKPLPEALVFGHMSVAFLGFLVIGLVLLSLSA